MARNHSLGSDGHKAFKNDNEKQNRGSGNRRVNGLGARGPLGAVPDGDAPDTPPDPNFLPQDGAAQEDDGDDIDIGDYDMEEVLKHPAVNGYDGAHGGAGNYDDDIANFVNSTVETFNADAATAPFTLVPDPKQPDRYLDPVGCLNNTGQRFVLTLFLEKVQSWHEYLNLTSAQREQASPPVPVRANVAGVAGTGKSYTLMNLRNIASIFRGTNGASCAVAPTGAAAGTIIAAFVVVVVVVVVVGF